MLTQDLNAMGPGDVARACLVDRKAHLVADWWIRRDEAGFLGVVPRAQLSEVVAMLSRHVIREEVEILSPTPARVWLVCGPLAQATLTRCGLESSAWPVSETRAAAGTDFLLVAENEARETEIAGGLDRADVPEIGEGTFERLRIEAGHARWGFDMGPGQFPMEVRLEAALNYEKGCYLGQETIARAHYRGHMNRGLIGIRFARVGPAGIPASGETLFSGAEEIGRITSVGAGPAGEDVLALGLVGRAHQIEGADVTAEGRPGRLEPLPFREARHG
jgi:folate-binding protein YgfZ